MLDQPWSEASRGSLLQLCGSIIGGVVLTHSMIDARMFQLSWIQIVYGCLHQLALATLCSSNGFIATLHFDDAQLTTRDFSD